MHRVGFVYTAALAAQFRINVPTDGIRSVRTLPTSHRQCVKPYKLLCNKNATIILTLYMRIIHRSLSIPRKMSHIKM